MEFVKDVLCSVKKVSQFLEFTNDPFLLQLCEQKKVKEIVIPQFEGFGINGMWEQAQEIPQLLLYFPKYPEGRLPNREFFFKGLLNYSSSSLSSIGLQQLVPNQAR